MVKKGVIIGSVIAVVVVAAGLGTLIWWLVTRGDDEPSYETIPLEGDGFGNVAHKAAFTRIPGSGDMFWWFYPTLAANATSRPLVLWLDGVVGLPPSLLANFGMIGPFDFNLNLRDNSWINEYNLLFVDAPLGAGFSTVVNSEQIPVNTEDTANHLALTLKSFYDQNSEFSDTPLYIFGQGYGGQLAISLALALHNSEHLSVNLEGVVLGNSIISPASASTHLGFYLEELGYIDNNGRAAIENFTNTINQLVAQGQYENAFDTYMALDAFVNDAGAVAINLRHILDKLYMPGSGDVFGQKKYLSDIVGFNIDPEVFMNGAVASALGITNAAFDSRQVEILEAFRGNFMVPATSKVEEILRNTDISVSIYNGNLDAISNTPGQLEWVNNLQWPGQIEFLARTRETLIVNRIIEGYFQETERLKFYWLNTAGLLAPADSPVAMRRILQRIMGE